MGKYRYVRVAFSDPQIYRCYILLLVLSFTGPFHRYSTTTLVNTSVGRRSRNIWVIVSRRGENETFGEY